jgi:hypothetical protein
VREASGLEALAFLMAQHGLRQGGLPEIGSQGVVSEILAGKRELNIRQVRALSERFGVSAATFVRDRALLGPMSWPMSWRGTRRVCGRGPAASMQGPFGLPCGARPPGAREANSALRASNIPRSSAHSALCSSAPHRRRRTPAEAYALPA